MHVELLVEEPSAEVAISLLFPRIVGHETTFAIHSFQGKDDLLKKLPSRLKGYRGWIPDDWRIVVLIDEDRQDCHRLKGTMEEAARAAGFVTRSSAGSGGRFTVLNRISIEELEAWFFGDVVAMAAAYPGIPATLDRQARYRDPDAILGGTWRRRFSVSSRPPDTTRADSRKSLPPETSRLTWTRRETAPAASVCSATPSAR